MDPRDHLSVRADRPGRAGGGGLGRGGVGAGGGAGGAGSRGRGRGGGTRPQLERAGWARTGLSLVPVPFRQLRSACWFVQRFRSACLLSFLLRRRAGGVRPASNRRTYLAVAGAPTNSRPSAQNCGRGRRKVYACESGHAPSACLLTMAVEGAGCVPLFKTNVDVMLLLAEWCNCTQAFCTNVETAIAKRNGRMQLSNRNQRDRWLRRSCLATILRYVLPAECLFAYRSVCVLAPNLTCAGGSQNYSICCQGNMKTMHVLHSLSVIVHRMHSAHDT